MSSLFNIRGFEINFQILEQHKKNCAAQVLVKTIYWQKWTEWHKW